MAWLDRPPLERIELGLFCIPTMTTSTEPAAPPRTAFSGWRAAAAVWLLGCILVGLVCFVWLGSRLRAYSSPFWAAVWWQLAFAAALAVILVVIVTIGTSRGTTLAEIGWGKPASRLSLFFGFVLGALYVAGVYAGILNDPAMRDVNPFAFHWVRLALAPVGIFMAASEEIMMRGFFMTELARARLGTTAQILLSGLCSAVYHSFHNLTWIGFIPSFVLFSLHAVLYVASRRSLTPSIVAHSMYHVLCAPYLLMFAMAQTRG